MTYKKQTQRSNSVHDHYRVITKLKVKFCSFSVLGKQYKLVARETIKECLWLTGPHIQGHRTNLKWFQRNFHSFLLWELVMNCLWG